MLDMFFNNRFIKKDFNVSLVKRVSVPVAENNINVVDRQGGEGSLYINMGGKKDIVVDVECNFIHKKPKDVFRAIKHWLNINNIENNELSFTDDWNWFYKVKDIKISKMDIKNKYKGSFTISFTCRGWHYKKSGTFPMELEPGKEYLLFNEHDDAKPNFYIEGNGDIELIINNKSTKVDNIEYFITINSEKELVYRYSTDIPMNLSAGDYPLLPYGYNTVQIKGDIEKAIMFPNWREV